MSGPRRPLSFWALGLAKGELQRIEVEAMMERASEYRNESYEARQSDEMASADHLVRRS